MKKKSIILLISILVIAVGVTAALIILNRSDDYESLMQMDNENSNSTENQNLSQETLTFYFMGQEPKVTKEILDKIEKHARDSLNIKLNFQFDEDKYYNGKNSTEQLKTFIKSGVPVDAFYFPSDSSVKLKSLADDNIIMDLTELSPKYAPKYFQSLSTEAKKAVSLNNRIYAIPNQMPNAKQTYALVNEKLMKEFNISSINCIADLELYSKKAKEKGIDIAPLKVLPSLIELFAEGNDYVILDKYQGLVYKWNDPNLKLMAWEQTPEYKNCIEILRNWYKQGYIARDNYTAAPDMSSFASGKLPALINYASPYDEQKLKKLIDEASDFKYKSYLLYPEKSYCRDNPLAGSMVVNKTSQHADRVLMFYEWLNSSQENYDLLMYGLKGKTYDMSEESVISVDSKSFNDMLSWPWKGPFTSILFERPLLRSTREDLQECSKRIEKNSKYAPHLGFSPNYSKLMDKDYIKKNNNFDIVTFRQNDYLNIEKEIASDSFKEADIDNYIKNSKSETDKLVAEIQRQLDSWRKNN